MIFTFKTAHLEGIPQLMMCDFQKVAIEMGMRNSPTLRFHYQTLGMCLMCFVLDGFTIDPIFKSHFLAGE